MSVFQNSIFVCIYVFCMFVGFGCYIWEIIILNRERKKYKKSIKEIKAGLTDEVMGFNEFQEKAIIEIINRESRFLI